MNPLTRITLVRSVHLAMAMLGAALWVLIAVASLVLVLLAVLGHRLWPSADMGNCWTFALPRWAMHGGELGIRMVKVGALQIPHAAWRRPDGTVEQTEPVERAESASQAWFGLKTIYFRFRVLVNGRRVVEGDAP